MISFFTEFFPFFALHLYTTYYLFIKYSSSKGLVWYGCCKKSVKNQKINFLQVFTIWNFAK